MLRALGSRRPQTRGVIRVAGPRAQIAIGRDRVGIPHVDASSDADAWFGLGFCHGQDRAFQLEILLRAGRGTLSEMAGAATVPIDRLSRTLGFHRVASVQVDRLYDEIRSQIDAYVAGINAAIGATPNPHELALLRRGRTAWTADDVLAFAGLQALALGGNWDTELARLQILLTDGPAALEALDTPYAAWQPAVAPVGATAGASLGRLASDVTRLRDLVGGAGASNAWAVDGSRSASGAPILANDPHLAPTVPAPWYLAHLTTPDWSVAGASFVGSPTFPSGHNGRVAWGITAACTDSADLFWEQLDLEAGSARGPEGPEPIERRTERIEIRGREADELEVVVTARGPIVTDVLDGVSTALSLRATWLEPVPVRGLLDVHRAGDVATFRELFADWPGPSLNVVFADAGGHIGWQLVGTLPHRAGASGTIPQPAWEPAAAWQTPHLPFDAMPHCVDPEAGFVVSANHAPRADAPDAPFLGVDWLDGWRAARIVESLESRVDWTVEAFGLLQTDLTAVAWRDLRAAVLAAEPSTDAGREAIALLAAWDGVLSVDAAAASVYELTLAELATAEARRLAPESWRWALGGGFGDAVPRTTFGARFVSRLVTSLRDDPGEGGAHDIGAALDRAAARLVAHVGPDRSRWAWGEARPLRLLHAFGTQRPLDRMLNLGPVPLGGDANTVAQAGVLPLDPLGNPAAIANHRMVIDLGDVERSRFVLAGGQSGNPLSPRYADLFNLWQAGEGVPIAFGHEAVVAATVDELLLRPTG